MTEESSPTVRDVKRSRSRNARVLRWFVLTAAALSLVGVGVLLAERRQETSPVARGAVLATSSGCFACHALSEGEQRGNFRQASPGAWRPRSIPTLWENGIDDAEVLKEWIANGVTAAEADRHKELFIRMPAYRAHLSPADIDAVCAWILAEGIRLSQPATPTTSAAVPAPPKTAGAAATALTGDALFREGDRLSRQHGCYQCHGELGQGGVSNPASFKGYVAGFFGADFAALTAGGDRAEVLHWIDHGRGRALESGATGRLAKYFLDRQAIQMPAYEQRLTAQEKAIVADYLLALNRAGPLGPKELERLMKLLSEELPEKS